MTITFFSVNNKPLYLSIFFKYIMLIELIIVMYFDIYMIFIKYKRDFYKSNRYIITKKLIRDYNSISSKKQN